MSRFRVTQPNDHSNNSGGGGIDNRAIEIDRSDPVQLNAYGLYTKRDSTTNPPAFPLQHGNDGHGQRKYSDAAGKTSARRDSAARKISLGFAQWTR